MPAFTRPNPDATCDPRHLAALMGLEPDDVDIDKEKVIVTGTPPANAQDIINAYVYDSDFGKPAAELTARQAVKQDFQTAYDKLTTGWSAMNQTQKAEALREGVVVCMKVVRFIAKRFLDA